MPRDKSESRRWRAYLESWQHRASGPSSCMDSHRAETLKKTNTKTISVQRLQSSWDTTAGRTPGGRPRAPSVYTQATHRGIGMQSDPYYVSASSPIGIVSPHILLDRSFRAVLRGMEAQESPPRPTADAPRLGLGPELRRVSPPSALSSRARRQAPPILRGNGGSQCGATNV